MPCCRCDSDAEGRDYCMSCFQAYRNFVLAVAKSDHQLSAEATKLVDSDTLCQGCGERRDGGCYCSDPHKHWTTQE